LIFETVLIFPKGININRKIPIIYLFPEGSTLNVNAFCFFWSIVENIGAALVAAHGKHKKSLLSMGGHKGGPYIFHTEQRKDI